MSIFVPGKPLPQRVVFIRRTLSTASRPSVRFQLSQGGSMSAHIAGCLLLFTLSNHPSHHSRPISKLLSNPCRHGTMLVSTKKPGFPEPEPKSGQSSSASSRTAKLTKSISSSRSPSAGLPEIRPTASNSFVFSRPSMSTYGLNPRISAPTPWILNFSCPSWPVLPKRRAAASQETSNGASGRSSKPAHISRLWRRTAIGLSTGSFAQTPMNPLW